MVVIILSVMGVVLAMGLAHWVGYRLSQFRHCEPGRGREVMPTFVSRDDPKGEAARRWDDNISRVEQKLLDHFQHLQGDITGVRADLLAPELDEYESLVEAALERMRQEIPCRLQVTRSGVLLHDFAARDLKELRDRRAQSSSFRILLFGLATMANISAIWPVLMVLMVAVITLDILISMPTDQAVPYGFAGATIVGAVVFAAWLGGLMIHYFLTPLMGAPALGYAHDRIQRKVLKDELKLERKIRGEGGFFRWSGSSTTYISTTTLHSQYGHMGEGFSANLRLQAQHNENKKGGGGGGSGGGGGGGGGAAHLILILFFIALIVACLFTIYIWLRGLYRAITGSDNKIESFGPAEWVRLVDDADWYERFLPTNDLISRMARSVRRALRRRRPGDLQLAGRIAELIIAREGRVSALDIALHEGLDPAEVAEVGAQLCRRFGGEIDVSDGGELVFYFSEKILQQMNLETGSIYEFLDRQGDRPMDLVREEYQPADKLPVNMVGLKYVHLRAGDYVVGGALLMYLTSIYVFGTLAPDQLQGVNIGIPQQIAEPIWQIGPLISAATLAFATGTVALVTTVRYLSKVLAIQGVMRDARRAYAHAIAHALEQEQDEIRLWDWSNQLRSLFEDVHDTFDHHFFDMECQGLLIDLGLENEIEYISQGRINTVNLRPLRERFQEVRRYRPDHLQADRSQWVEDLDDEEQVVFDTEMAPERIRAL